jgi:uncharacterized protein YyaL (SSP411 family)
MKPIEPRRWNLMSLKILMLFSALLVTGSDQPVSNPPKADKKRAANHLAGESSPYLLMHAHNPVNWYPWGPEAFAKAKKEGKLIFLSIGYSSCYWCHVMERESFENNDVAKLLNEWFVCVKVDREERPDVDTVYMTALSVSGQRGGWPLSMFLTPEGKPIFGGTYWPADDFKSVLKRVQQLHTDKQKELDRQAERIASLTKEELAGRSGGIAPATLDRSLATAAVKGILDEFDKDYGGFGSPERQFRGTKFPMPPYLELLLHEADQAKSKEALEAVGVTLDRMARGGIYDQLGSGFHRYSTERTWTVPHFEKMLYDNAQLAEVYAKAYRLTPKPIYRRIVEETLAFVKRELTSPEGAFYSALDAETGGMEGRFYVWTGQELDEALGNAADARLFKRAFGLDGRPNFEERYYILTLPKPFEEMAKEEKVTAEELEKRASPLRQRLSEARSKRSRPFLDTKVISAWNGQMIAGFAKAGEALDNKAFIEVAARAAEFILKNLRNSDGRLLRTYGAAPGQASAAKILAYLDDYALLVHGLLCLHDATVDPRWLKYSQDLTEDMIKFHLDNDRGGFFYTANDHEKLFARAKDQYDGAQPSGNSVAARNLVRLWTKTGDHGYQQLAEKTLKAFSGNLKANPTSMATMAEALTLYLDADDQTKSKSPLDELPTSKDSKPKKSEAVVKIEATATKPDADNRQTITVTIAIEKPWHLYANPVPEDFPGIPTSLTAESQGKSLDVKVDYPRGKLVKDKTLGNYHVYEDQVKIQASVQRSKDDVAPLTVIAKIQACSDKQCLLPGTVKVKIP